MTAESLAVACRSGDYYGMQSDSGIVIDLTYLRWHWGSAYDIAEALNVWRAVRRDNGVTLVATGAEELRLLIVADYAERPVPR